MELLDSSGPRDPLDLLRRFIPTPLRTRFRIGNLRVAVETNDFTLLPALPLEMDSAELAEPSLEWKLVRDLDTSGVLEAPLLLTSGNLTVVTMGTACLLGMDQEHRELLCFIGSGVDSRTFQDFLVPFLCRLSEENLGGVSDQDFNEWNDEKTDA